MFLILLPRDDCARLPLTYSHQVDCSTSPIAFASHTSSSTVHAAHEIPRPNDLGNMKLPNLASKWAVVVSHLSYPKISSLQPPKSRKSSIVPASVSSSVTNYLGDFQEQVVDWLPWYRTFAVGDHCSPMSKLRSKPFDMDTDLKDDPF